MPTIALVDDDKNILTSVSMALEQEGYHVRTYTDGAAALAAFSSTPPDLAILDIKMPRMDGMEVLRRLRQKSELPVIFLTSKDEEIDELMALNAGADDYIKKPFSQRLLLERVRAVLRRADHSGGATDAPKDTIIELDDLRIEVGGREVFVGGERVALTPKEFDLLVLLVEHADAALSRARILQSVWGYCITGDTRTVDMHIMQLRKKLDFRQKLKSVIKVGYRLDR